MNFQPVEPPAHVKTIYNLVFTGVALLIADAVLFADGVWDRGTALLFIVFVTILWARAWQLTRSWR